MGINLFTNARRDYFYSLRNNPEESSFIPEPLKLSQGIITVNSEIRTKYVTTLCEQEVEFSKDKPGGKKSNKINLEEFTDLPTNEIKYHGRTASNSTAFMYCTGHRSKSLEVVNARHVKVCESGSTASYPDQFQAHVALTLNPITP